MNCERCGSLIRRTLSDKVGKLGLYKTVAYYCDACDEIFILPKYADILDKHKYDEELVWLREQNPNMHQPE